MVGLMEGDAIDGNRKMEKEKNSISMAEI